MKISKLLLFSSALLISILFSGCKKPGACISLSKSDPKEDESITFTSCSTDASSFEWDFGDNTSSTEESPAHTYNKEGTYTVKLKALSKNKKKFSETSETITVLSKWTTLSSGTTANLNSVHFTDANTGYAAGNNGLIIKTTNGGSSWLAQTSNTSQHLNAITFRNTSSGFIVGANATINKTTDGINWNTSSGFNGALYDVHFGSGNYGALVGQSGLVFFTINSGLTYTSNAAIISNDLHGVYFTSTSNAFAVGNGGTIIKSTTGGVAWSIISSGTSADLNDVFFTDVNTGYAVGNSMILKTTNAGTSWSQYTAFSGKINSVYFIDVNTGYAACESGAILKTDNAGGTWTIHKEPNNVPLNGIYFVNSAGYAVGDNGSMFKF